jgi:hypothetical protein
LDCQVQSDYNSVTRSLSRSQLYHYFEDRADLSRAVVYATADAVLGSQLEHVEHLDSWAGITAWFDALVSVQEGLDARGGCPIGSLVGQPAERDEGARDALARSLTAGNDIWPTGPTGCRSTVRFTATPIPRAWPPRRWPACKAACC